MKRIIMFSLLLLVVIVPLQGKESNMQAAFIEDIIGARAWGMAGAYRTLVNDATALIWNPAGMLDIEGKYNVAIEHVELMDFFSYSYLGYVHRLDDKWTLGTGLLYSGDDIMSEFLGYLSLAVDGSVIGDAVAGGKVPEGLINAGISGKVLYSSFGGNGYDNDLPGYLHGHQVSGSALGFALDLGFKVRPTERDQFSLTFKNLLNRVGWDSENTAGTAQGSYSENLPVTWTVGYVRHQDRFRFALDIDKSLYYDVEDNIHLGLEYLVRKELSLRVGFAQELVTADSQRFTLGAGINIDLPAMPAIRVDLAYLNYLEWENNNSLLLGISFAGR